MAEAAATAAFDATARTSDRRYGAGCGPSPQLGWGPGMHEGQRSTSPLTKEAREVEEETRRHGGIGYELVLANAVPQLGGEEVQDLFLSAFRRIMLEEKKADKDQEKAGNKMRKKRKRRKQKLPKAPLPLPLPRRSAVDQGIMFECAEDENGDAVTIEYVRADVLKIHTVVTYTLQADPLNSVHCKEVAGYSGRAETTPCMNEMSKFTKEKVIRKGEFIHKNGQLGLSLYGDCTHLTIQPSGIRWLHWIKNRHPYIRRLRCSPGGGQVHCLHLHAAKTVMKSGLSKRCLVHRLTRR